MANKPIACFFSGVLFFCACGVNNHNTDTPNNHPGFQLYYSYAGLGSNMGKMYPVFRVEGNNYTYTLQQNSFYGKPDKEPELVSKGVLRNSSIDSIIELANRVTDTMVYRTNPEILSGGIHSISVSHNNKKVSFSLHNAYDSIAGKIVNILNTNIPAGSDKLWLFSLNQ